MFLFVVALMAAVTTSAQEESDIMSATLIHGDLTSVYYTSNAFRTAIENAADGDVIILSPGTFDSNGNTANLLGKSVSIYGSGFDTKINGEIFITEVQAYDEYGKEYYYYPTVKIEGLSASNVSIKEINSNSATVLSGLQMRKCKFTKNAYSLFNVDTKNCKFSQCIFNFTNTVSTSYQYDHQGLVFENCHFSGGRINTMGDNENNILFDHCIIATPENGCIATYTNCIISSSLPGYSTAYNNIFVNPAGPGTNVVGDNNWFKIATSGIYAAVDEDGSYSDDKDFALKYPEMYVGTDGTEVGINGGNGFSRIPAVPRILSSEIDTRSSADGKINVSITVEAQTKE